MQWNVQPMIEHLEEVTFLRQHGHRLTPQRLQVLQAIKAHGHHVTAEEIHATIVPQQPFLDIATVYRVLQWLQSVGLVAPINVGDGKQHYEFHPIGAFHHHLICLRCGCQTQIPDDYFAALKAEIAQQYHFVLQIDHLPLTGVCASCFGANADPA